jgi:hypothetical protein
VQDRPDLLKKMVAATRQRTNNPFGVGVIL